MKTIKTIIIEKDIINSEGTIIIPKGKKIRLDSHTIDRLKASGIYYKLLNSSNEKFNILKRQQIDSIKALLKKHLDYNNHFRKVFESNNESDKLDILNILNEFLFESKNEEWYVYLSLLCDGYEWYYSHSINVAYVSASIGLKLGYTKEQIRNLILGSLIHDIGVVLIPKDIVLKSKKFFSPAERLVFQKHSLLGYDMIKNLSIPETVKNMVLDHHKCLDGSGYPATHKSNNMSIDSQIIVVADYFDEETYQNKTCEEVILHFLNNPDKFPLKIVAILKNILKL